MVLPPPPAARKVRKHLSADALYALVREGFGKVADHRDPKATIPLADALMSAFAMFSLKDPSLLAFQERRSDPNLKALFGIGRMPSDTQMREILDPVDPEHLRPLFGAVFRQLQRGKALEPFAFYAGHYLLSLDGTGYFSSGKVKTAHFPGKTDLVLFCRLCSIVGRFLRPACWAGFSGMAQGGDPCRLANRCRIAVRCPSWRGSLSGVATSGRPSARRPSGRTRA
jgi:hypothetical protein